MSTESPFEHIKKFCRDRNLVKLHERILFHKFNEDFYDLIASYETSENKAPSADIVKGFESTLLSDNTLSTNIRLADEEIDEHIEKEIKKVERKYSFGNFSLSVFASLLASFLFAIILVLIFTVAQSQIRSWVDDLYNNHKYIEQKVSNTD